MLLKQHIVLKNQLDFHFQNLREGSSQSAASDINNNYLSKPLQSAYRKHHSTETGFPAFHGNKIPWFSLTFPWWIFEMPWYWYRSNSPQPPEARDRKWGFSTPKGHHCQLLLFSEYVIWLWKKLQPDGTTTFSFGQVNMMKFPDFSPTGKLFDHADLSAHLTPLTMVHQ